jgi:membrane protein DedA with SNARE-associated domain
MSITPGLPGLAHTIAGTVTAMPRTLAHLPVTAAYGLLGGAVLAESVLLVGAFVPTLAMLLTAGVLARAGQLSLPLVIAVAAAAVVCGDALGHRTGRVLGARLRTGRLARRVPQRGWARTEALMESYGGQAVFGCRFLPVLRTLAPPLAGATGLPYRRIAPYSVVAACLWAAAEAGAGYVAAASLGALAPGAGAGLALVLCCGLLVRRVVRGRRRRRPLGRGRGRGRGPVAEASAHAPGSTAVGDAASATGPAGGTARAGSTGPVGDPGPAARDTEPAAR